VLDAVATVLGVCLGEIMKGACYETGILGGTIGKDILGLEPILQGDVLVTTCLIEAFYRNLGRVSVADLALSAHVYLAKGLAALAIHGANEKKVKNVGFSGGAACNQILAQQMRATIEAAGLQFFVHQAVPAGDGGVSFGQAVVAGFSKF
jgi:hydrogenase maturation protein HypF